MNSDKSYDENIIQKNVCEGIPAMIGTWAWGNDGSFGREYSREKLLSVFKKAVPLGFKMWDTAYVYGYGRSESTLADFIRETGYKDICISDKFTPYHAKEFPGDSVRLMLEESLRILGTDHIDIYWIHNPIEYKKWLPAFAELQKEGKITKIGLSNFGREEIRESERILAEYGTKPYAVQNHYSLLARSSEYSGITDYCREKDIRFFGYMILEQGALTGKYDSAHLFDKDSGRGKNYNKVLRRYEELNCILKNTADRYGLSLSAFSIAWAMSKGVIPIIGVTKEEYIDDIISASKVVLSEEDIKIAEEAAERSGMKTTRMWERVYE